MFHSFRQHNRPGLLTAPSLHTSWKLVKDKDKDKDNDNDNDNDNDKEKDESAEKTQHVLYFWEKKTEG